MPVPLDRALAEIRQALLDQASLRRAVAAGRRRGPAPGVVRADLRPVSLKAGSHLQIVTSDGVRPRTRNVAWGPDAAEAVDALLAEPFGNWHVESSDATRQLRVTKKGEAQLHRGAPVDSADREAAHDREKAHLLDPGHPLFEVIGGNAAKRRQVDAFLRVLESALSDVDDAALPAPLRVVDLGCGNAYLTFAAYQYLTSHGLDARLVGVDVRSDQRARNTELAHQLGWAERVSFVAGTIGDVDLPGADVVLALHACDTATDEALARAVRWRASLVLAAPCCHHDIAAQLRSGSAPPPYQMLTRHSIMRERFADLLTDSLRAALLRLHGYHVDVVEFVQSAHTPRNMLLRAKFTGAEPTDRQRDEYEALVSAWGVTPALARLLHEPSPGRLER